MASPETNAALQVVICNGSSTFVPVPGSPGVVHAFNALGKFTCVKIEKESAIPWFDAQAEKLCRDCGTCFPIACIHDGESYWIVYSGFLHNASMATPSNLFLNQNTPDLEWVLHVLACLDTQAKSLNTLCAHINNGADADAPLIHHGRLLLDMENKLVAIPDMFTRCPFPIGRGFLPRNCSTLTYTTLRLNAIIKHVYLHRAAIMTNFEFADFSASNQHSVMTVAESIEFARTRDDSMKCRRKIGGAKHPSLSKWASGSAILAYRRKLEAIVQQATVMRDVVPTQHPTHSASNSPSSPEPVVSTDDDTWSMSQFSDPPGYIHMTHFRDDEQVDGHGPRLLITLLNDPKKYAPVCPADLEGITDFY